MTKSNNYNELYYHIVFSTKRQEIEGFVVGEVFGVLGGEAPEIQKSDDLIVAFFVDNRLLLSILKIF